MPPTLARCRARGHLLPPRRRSPHRLPRPHTFPRQLILPLALACTDARGQRAPDARPVTAFEGAKAEALLRGRLPCLGCHTLDGDGGRIGPDLTTVGKRRPAAYIASMVADPQGTRPGALMPRTPMAPEVERLVVRYLVTRAGAGAPAAPPAAAAPAMGVGAATPAAPDAPALYARWCAACHGPAGRGDGPNARHLPVRPAAHADSAAMARRSDDALYDAVAAGGYVMNRSPRMPAFGATLSDAEIRALVRHIRALCRCEGPAWSRDGIGAEGAR